MAAFEMLQLGSEVAGPRRVCPAETGPALMGATAKPLKDDRQIHTCTLRVRSRWPPRRHSPTGRTECAGSVVRTRPETTSVHPE
eukprot:scaffold1034_cov418-Prasinococcus_capsulatus_cf.AAC.26